VRRYQFSLLFFLVPLFQGFVALAQSLSTGAATHPEVVRVLGFEEHQQQKKQNNQELERGLRLHLESLEIQAREYEKARREYQAEKRSEVPPEKQPSYREHVESRDEQRKERFLAVQEQRRIKAEERRLLKNIHLDGSRELGLPENRPRYEIDKRALYGAEPKFSRSKEVFPGGGGYTPPANNNFGSGSGSGNQDVFPPPAPFDDFPPPPTFPEGDFDLPPPPPMDADPMMPGGGEDFFPPPPPPAFDDNFNF
jgi:hypothetical protein